MTPRALRLIAAAVAVAALASVAFLPRARSARAAEPAVIEIVARRFQFTPSEITLRKDEPVILRLQSQDVTHGFFLRQLGIDTTIEPGKPTELAITPHQAGKFTAICHHFCGTGHGNMHMTIVVE
jgi:cytochrome c oxidase subunit 2